MGLIAAQVRTRQALFRSLVDAILFVDGHTRTFHLPVSGGLRSGTREIEVDPSCQSFFVRRGSASYAARSDYIWTLYAMDAAFVSLRAGFRR